jgi:hypothetical protein
VLSFSLRQSFLNKKRGENVMKKALIVATALAAFAPPALALGPFSVMFVKAANKCVMSRTAPADTAKFAIMGEYKTEADAKMAMAGMTKC